MSNTTKTQITADRLATVKAYAARAARHDLVNERRPRADWWTGEYAAELGIVDAHGVAHLTGEVPSEFARLYRAAMRRG